MSHEQETPGLSPRQGRIIGIVGGLGPRAHIQLESHLLRSAAEILGARKDQDFPEWILSSMPQTPDRTQAVKSRAADPTPWLVRSVKRLEGCRQEQGGPAAGADFAVIACVSAHMFLPAVRRQVRIPIVSMVTQTARAIAAAHPQAKVGVLATTGTLESGIFHDELRQRDLAAVSLLDLPDGQSLQAKLVMEPIYGPVVDGVVAGGGIKGDDVRPEHIEALTMAGTMLVESAGAEVIVAGCTEIGLAFIDRTSVCGAALIDPMRVIADVAIRLAFDLMPLEEQDTEEIRNPKR